MVCDTNIARAEALAAHSGDCKATESIKDVAAASNVDITMIATVNAALAPLAAECLEGGKHVLVEKPGAIRSNEIENLQRLATDNNRQVRVGFNHRYHPACLKAREIVDSGALGPIMFLRGRYGQGGRVGYDKEWRAIPEMSGGGELIDQGVHLIDLAGIFLGDFTTVDGHATTYFWDMPVDDNAFLNLRNEGNHTAWLQVSCSEWKNMFSLEIYGRDGKLHWEGLGGSYGIERLYHYAMLPEMGPPDTTIYEFPRGDQSWQLEMNEFFQDIKLNRTPIPGLTEAGKVLKVVETIYEKSGLPA
jgi:predicted dehydrogenase